MPWSGSNSIYYLGTQWFLQSANSCPLLEFSRIILSLISFPIFSPVSLCGLLSYSCWSYGPITFFLSFIFFELVFYFYVFLLYYLEDLLNLIIPRFFWIFYSASPQVPFSIPLMFLKKIMQCSCFMGSISPLIPLWILIIVFWSLRRLSFFHIAFCLLVSVSTFQVGFP